MDRDRMLDLFLRLSRIHCLSLCEREVASAVERELRAIGLEPWYDRAGEAIGGECGNLWARLPATAPGLPTILLCSHLDTVGPAEGIIHIVEDDTVRSEGATIIGADNRAGVVVILETLRALMADDAPHGEVLVVLTVAEETGLQGAQAIDFGAVGADAAYVPDGGETVGKMTTAAPYANRMTYTVTGVAAHAGGSPEQGVNAIVAASRAIAAMPLGRIDEETTANIGVIEGGVATNIVPALTVAHGEARSHSLQKLTDQTDRMSQCMVDAAAEVGATVEIEVRRSYDGFCVPDDAPVVRWAWAAAERLGFTPMTAPGGGGSDANVFNAHGIPAIIMSCGASAAHSVNERLSVTAMVDSARWLAASIQEAARG